MGVRGIHFVGAVVDDESGATAHAHVGVALVMFGEPEFSGLGVHVMDFGATNPEGRIAGGLGLDFGDGEVTGVDPDGATIEEAGVGPWLNLEFVARPAVDDLLGYEGEVVIGGGGSGFAGISRRLQLGFEQLLQNMVRQHLRTSLGDDAELFLARSGIGRFDDDGSAQVGGKTPIGDRVGAALGIALQIFGTLLLSVGEALHNVGDAEMVGCARDGD